MPAIKFQLGASCRQAWVGCSPPAPTGLITPIWCAERFGPMLLWANRRGKAGWGQNRRERTAGQITLPTPAPGHFGSHSVTSLSPLLRSVDQHLDHITDGLMGRNFWRLWDKRSGIWCHFLFLFFLLLRSGMPSDKSDWFGIVVFFFSPTELSVLSDCFIPVQVCCCKTFFCLFVLFLFSLPVRSPKAQNARNAAVTSRKLWLFSQKSKVRTFNLTPV